MIHFPACDPEQKTEQGGMLKDPSGCATSNTQPYGQNRFPNKNPWKFLELGTGNREVGI